MKSFYYIIQFILISFLFNIFKLIGFKNSSNLGFLIGKTLGPIVRPKSSIIKNLKKANIKGDLEKIAALITENKKLTEINNSVAECLSKTIKKLKNVLNED